MDMAFLRRAERILEERQALRLDYRLLVAAVSAQQTVITISGDARPTPPSGGSADDDPLIELLLGGPRWREAASRQRGCFSRAEAGRRINDA